MSAVQIELVGEGVCEFRTGPSLLARYVAAPNVPREESPRPVLHPVCTLSGRIVTDFRPSDHPWHHGISWAFTYINGDTFWGGPTFVNSKRNYRWLDNHGSQRHAGWKTLPEGVLEQAVEWVARSGTVLMFERRRIAAWRLGTGLWGLEFDSEFLASAERPLRLSSPVGEGRPEGGYFGLAWRGSSAWQHGTIATPEGPAGSVMGRRASWLRYQTWNSATLLFVDHPANPRHPTTWFERHADQPLVSFALAYREPLRLEPEAPLRLRYSIVIADGPLSARESWALASGFATNGVEPVAS
jgi:hypothetical protein